MKFSEYVKKSIRSGNAIDIAEIEIGIRDAALRDGSIALGKILSGISDPNPSETSCPFCSSAMENIGLRKKQIISLLGKGTLERVYLGCTNKKCNGHRLPKDELLDIKKTSFTPGMRRLIAKMGHECAFQKGSEDIYEFTGITVSAKDIERVSESIGKEIEIWDTKNHEELLKINPVSNLIKDIPIMYIECDGTGVPVVSKEVAGRKGKQEDGTAKTRESKLGCVFTQTGVDKNGDPCRDKNSTTYFGAIETCEEFGKRLSAESIKRGLWRASNVVFIGDGAKWIWNIANDYFFGAVEIVDMYHAKEHLHNLIRLLFGEKEKHSDLAVRWIKLLESGSIESIISEANNLEPKDDELQKQIDKELNYFTVNTKRMRYSSFKEKGYFVGSGVIEAGCKTVIGKRLKQSGMRWSVRGANSIIALRCNIISKKFDEFWDNRSA